MSTPEPDTDDTTDTAVPAPPIALPPVPAMQAGEEHTDWLHRVESWLHAVVSTAESRISAAEQAVRDLEGRVPPEGVSHVVHQ